MDRGNLKFNSKVNHTSKTSTDTVSNNGSKVEVTFSSQNIGRLAVVFGDTMVATFMPVSKTAFVLTFDPAHPVPVVFFGLIRSWKFPPISDWSRSVFLKKWFLISCITKVMTLINFASMSISLWKIQGKVRCQNGPADSSPWPLDDT